jgi:hypothetical protein
MTSAALALVVTLIVAGSIERARWQRACRKLANIGSFTHLLAMKEDDTKPEDPFALVVDLTTGRRWTTEPKPNVQQALGGTRR